MRSHNASDLFDLLRAMGLPSDSYAVFGSGPLAVRGLIDEVGDLDIIVDEVSWNRVKHLGTIVTYGDDMVADLGNGLTFGRSWAYGNVDIGQLIEDADVIDGLPFVQLSAVVDYKRIAGRPKDLRHIEVIERAGEI